MFQNRVNPFGEIIPSHARGAWLGNRGVLHNDLQEIVRPYKVKAWITCMLEFRGRHREIMQSGRWTELFFLDEATSFSAGHRPCFQCRYRDHQRFKSYWLEGNPEYGFTMATPISAIDDVLHLERMSSDLSFVSHVSDLPDGSFVLHEEQPYLIKGGVMYLWSAGGYGKGLPLAGEGDELVLTPPSIVRMFSAGYLPQMGV